jgi:hypothetical protein
MISPWGRRGKGIGFADRSVAPALPRPTSDPLDSLATSATVRFKTAQGSSRGSRVHGLSRCETKSVPRLFGAPHSSAESRPRYAFWREGLVATLKVAQAELPSRNAEERLIRSPPFAARASFAIPIVPRTRGGLLQAGYFPDPSAPEEWRLINIPFLVEPERSAEDVEITLGGYSAGVRMCLALASIANRPRSRE